MKRLFIIALFSLAITVNAQVQDKKEIPLSLKQHEFLLSVKKVDVFKNYVKFDIPSNVVEYSSCGNLLYSRFITDSSTSFVFMPDGELRINRILNNDYYTTAVYYLRFINGVVCGYFLANKPDGSVVMQIIKNTNDNAYDFTLKPVK